MSLLPQNPDGEDGPLAYQEYTIPGNLLGYPQAERQYAAIDFNVRRAFDEVWMMRCNLHLVT